MNSLLKGKAKRLAHYLKSGKIPLRIGSWRHYRRLSPRPGLTPATDSARRLNKIVAKMEKNLTYLEIGVEAGATLENIIVKSRWGVDPRPLFDTQYLPIDVFFFQEPSDQFFARPDLPLFDLIFIDGLHTWKQAYRDLMNSLRHAAEDAIVLLDDCVPSDEISAMPDQSASYELRRTLGQGSTAWCGDVFRVLYVLDRWHPELDFMTIAHGLGTNEAIGQAVIWRSPGSNPSVAKSFSRTDLDQIEAVSWKDAFGGVEWPPFMRAQPDEDLVIAAATKKG